MLPEQVHEVIGTPPYMALRDAQLLWKLMSSADPQPKSVLELGFMCGTGTCYYAGIMDELDGRVTSVDVQDSATYNPLAEDQLERLGLRNRVTIYREAECYTWRLLKFLQEEPRPQFDWVHIDGSHRWIEDSMVIFLLDKLVPVGGHILLENIHFTFGHPARNPNRVKRCADRYSEEEMHTPQLYNIWELVMKEHCNLGEFEEYDVEDNWGYGIAKKIRDL